MHIFMPISYVHYVIRDLVVYMPISIVHIHHIIHLVAR